MSEEDTKEQLEDFEQAVQNVMKDPKMINHVTNTIGSIVKSLQDPASKMIEEGDDTLSLKNEVTKLQELMVEIQERVRKLEKKVLKILKTQKKDSEIA